MKDALPQFSNHSPLCFEKRSRLIRAFFSRPGVSHRSDRSLYFTLWVRPQISYSVSPFPSYFFLRFLSVYSVSITFLITRVRRGWNGISIRKNAQGARFTRFILRVSGVWKSNPELRHRHVLHLTTQVSFSFFASPRSSPSPLFYSFCFQPDN